MHILPDTRPYPTDPVKNELLMYAEQMLHANSQAQRVLAKEQLSTQIHTMLFQKHTLSLSVAMSMAANREIYATLMDTLNDTLNAKENSEEIQWFAFPVVVIAGAKQAAHLSVDAPIQALQTVLAQYPSLQAFTHATWLPQLLRASDFAQIKAEQWFDAKQNQQAAMDFAATLPTKALAIPKDQSVHVVYALGYGHASLCTQLGKPLQEAALPLMQVWQQHFAQKDLTLFTNPLTPNSPLAALSDASHMRLRMALDVFSANAIRAIRLQSPRVGVVMAAQEGGKLLFGFNASDSAFELQPQVFTWSLSPRENIALVQQDFLNLMLDCHVEQIYLLHHPLLENEALPTFAQAQNLAGNNPLFS